MNSISPISSVNFLGARQTAVKKVVETPRYLNIGITYAPLYKQTPKMQELVSKIFKYFSEQSKKAEEALSDLQKNFPYFSISYNKRPHLSGKNVELRERREVTYTKGDSMMHMSNDADFYEIHGKNSYGIPNFMCMVTTPESGLWLYEVPNIFNKTKANNQPTAQTQRNVENCLQAVVDHLK